MPDMTGISTTEFRKLSLLAYDQREDLRKNIGLSGIVFLFVGRLESGKGIIPLMQAIEQRKSELTGRCSFLFVGSGALQEEAEARAKTIMGIPFHFQGFVQPEQLPQFFAMGDVFIMPTLDDNWPLVNLEALAAGLPQIYSIFNGGMMDMNPLAGIGEAIDPRDVAVVGQRLVDCVNSPVMRIQSEEALSLLNHYSPESQAQRAVCSLKQVLGGG
ncbi:MAG: glycosyltransferase family 4 protein [Akkermansiaceae bacterium]